MRWFAVIALICTPVLAQPSTGYDTATITNPGGDLTDFTLLVKLSTMSASWWSAVDTADGTKGRCYKDDGTTELAADWIDFDNGAETGWVRILYSGTLSSTGTQIIRIYPPNTANSSVLATATYGGEAAYNSGWAAYYPLHDLADRTDSSFDLTANNGPSASAGGKVVGYYDLESGSTQYLRYNAGTVLADWPVTLMIWGQMESQSTTMVPIMLQDGQLFYIRWEISDAFDSRIGGDQDRNSAGFGTGTWYHFAARANSSEHEIYVNGAGTGSPDAHTRTWSNPNDLLLGWDNAGVNWYWDGLLADAQVHSAERSSNWIAEEYAQANNQASFWGTWAWTAPAPAGPSIPVVMHHRRQMSFADDLDDWETWQRRWLPQPVFLAEALR